MQERYNAAVVGAGLAGCTAAILFARRGLRVALIERQRNVDAYKKLCTHVIQASAAPVLAELGLGESIEAAGGVPHQGLQLWTRWGWIRFPLRQSAHGEHGYNLRRSKLDPLLRRRAAATPGVELLVGCSACGLLEDAGRVSGVVVQAPDGSRREIAAPLLVGADGRYSRVAALAGVEATVKPNNRFSYFAYYRRLPLAAGNGACLWLRERDLAMAAATDDGLTLVACYSTTDQLTAFKGDLQGGFVRFFDGLPDFPPLGEGERVSELRGYLDLPNILRPAARPGLALVGDAALALDPLFAAGCGWAFQSAAWLVDDTAAALLGEAELDRGLERYARRHRAELGGFRFALAASLSAAAPLTWLDKLCLAGAARFSTLAHGWAELRGRDLALTAEEPAA